MFSQILSHDIPKHQTRIHEHDRDGYVKLTNTKNNKKQQKTNTKNNKKQQNTTTKNNKKQKPTQEQNA